MDLLVRVADVRDSTSGITPVVKLDGNGTLIATPAMGQTGLISTTNPLPYTAFATTPDAYNGQGVGYYPVSHSGPQDLSVEPGRSAYA